MLRAVAIGLMAVVNTTPLLAQQPGPIARSASSGEEVMWLQTQNPPAPPDSDDGAEDDHNPTRGWNRMKRGFYSGLIAGGIVGVILAVDCGHPECGPLISLGAGAGAGIGLTIDLLLVPERPDGPATARTNDSAGVPFANGRRVALGFRKRW